MDPIFLNAAAFPAEDGCGRQHRVLLQSAVIAPDALLGFDDVLVVVVGAHLVATG